MPEREPMPTECIAEQYEFEAFDGGPCDRPLRTRGICFIDHRTPELVVHELPTLVGQRICGIALGYKDLNDHDHLRHDSVLNLLSDRLAAKREECVALAGKSTLNRLEHAPSGAPGHHQRIGPDGAAMRTNQLQLWFRSSKLDAAHRAHQDVCERGQRQPKLVCSYRRCLPGDAQIETAAHHAHPARNPIRASALRVSERITPSSVRMARGPG